MDHTLTELGTNLPKKRRARAPKMLDVVKHPETAPSAAGLPGYVRIVLSHDANIPPTGQFFGINGKGYILRAGIAADVPSGIVDILNNAIYTEPELDPQTMQVNGYRQRLRFPYTIVGGSQRAA